jgi:GntR family transcriptional regulator/MocR family aminotransferase
MLIRSLQQEFGDKVQVHGAEAGMHLTITLPEGLNDVEIVAKAASERLWLLPLSTAYSGADIRHGLFLGFGSTPVDQIPSAVRRLRDVIGI